MPIRIIHHNKPNTMLDLFDIEKHIQKKIKKLLNRQAENHRIPTYKLRLAINCIIGKAAVHVYEQGTYKSTLHLKELAEFFGTTYHEELAQNVYQYLQKVAGELNIELPHLYLIICETNGQPGVHAYNEHQYLRALPLDELIAYFLKK